MVTNMEILLGGSDGVTTDNVNSVSCEQNTKDVNLKLSETQNTKIQHEKQWQMGFTLTWKVRKPWK